MGQYAYSGYLWLPLGVTVFAAFLSWYGWRRRTAPAALPFSVGALFAALWTLGSLLEAAAVDPASKIFWLKFLTLWQLPAVTATTVFLLTYAGLRRFLTPRVLALLAIPLLLFMALVVTDGLHHLFWRAIPVVGGEISPERAPAASAFLVYSYLLFLVDVAVLSWLFWTSARHRPPVALMLTGQVSARVIFELGDRAGLVSSRETGPLLLGVVLGLYAVALFRFHVLDPVALARAVAIDQMLEGMMVLDPQGRVVEANPAAERMLGQSAEKLRGQQADDLLPRVGPTGGLLAPAASRGGASGSGKDWQTEFGSDSGPHARRYRMAASPLRDKRGGDIGRLLLLHDITEEKRAQELRLEKQEVVATFKERERLARELHDGIGQVLAYVGLQAETARDCWQKGDAQKAELLMARLIEVAHRAHGDLRHSILALQATPNEGWSFLTSLEHQLDEFRSRYGVQTELIVADSLPKDVVTPAAGAQVLRVVQEALSNIRHADAQNVRVAVARRDGRACITVSDDGCGFDPTEVARVVDPHFGLIFMNERMEQIGGTLAIKSHPGSGTWVMIETPLGKAAEPV
jgi:signal transduction histidine kinase